MEIKNFNLNIYLKRLNYSESRSPTFETLIKLCWSHVTHIPVDTLDVFNNRKKTLDLDEIYDSIILKGRGGWCYELNGLFAVLLKSLGYSVTLLEGSCYMPRYDKFSAPFDHLYLKVILDEKEFLVDVAYGAPSFFEPMLFNFTPQTQMTGVYQFRKVNDNEFYVEKKKKKLINAITNQPVDHKLPPCQYSESDDWQLIARFSGTPRNWRDYAQACSDHQTDKNGFYTNNSFLEIFHSSGVTVLWGTKLIEKEFVDPMTELIKHSELLPGSTPSQANDKQKSEMLHLIKSKFGVALDFWPNFMSNNYNAL